MLSPRHIITVTPIANGWAWKLTDQHGYAAAAGFAPHQEAAMESGWRAARSFAPAPMDPFPEIVLGDHDASRRANN